MSLAPLLETTSASFRPRSPRLLAAVTTAEARLQLQRQFPASVLPLGIPVLDELLPDGGLPQGSVTELQVHGASGAATSFALCACRAAQAQSARASESASNVEHAQVRGPRRSRAPATIDVNWCAFIDPSATLFAPAVAQLGVRLDRLLVVRPGAEALERIAVRVAEAKVVSVLVIDARGAFDDDSFDQRRWQRTIRRLSLASENVATTILVITRADPRATCLPLPVAMRLELERVVADAVEVRIAKERTGRISPARSLAWSAFCLAATASTVVQPERLPPRADAFGTSR